MLGLPLDNWNVATLKEIASESDMFMEVVQVDDSSVNMTDPLCFRIRVVPSKSKFGGIQVCCGKGGAFELVSAVLEHVH